MSVNIKNNNIPDDASGSGAQPLDGPNSPSSSSGSGSDTSPIVAGSVAVTAADLKQVSSDKMMAILTKLLSLINELTEELIRQQSQNQNRQLQITDDNAKAASKTADISAAEAQKTIAKLDKAEHLKWWQKMLKIVIPIVSIVIAFATFGAGAGAVAALTTVVSMLLDPSSPIGQLGKAMQEHLPKGVLLGLSIGITVLMTVACASAGARFAAQEAAASAASAAEEAGSVAGSSALQVAEESGSSVAMGAEQVAGSEAEAAESQLSRFQQFKEAMKNPQWFLGMNAAASTFASTQPILYIVAISKKESLEKAQADSLNTYLTLAMTLIMMLGTIATGIGGSLGGASTSVSAKVAQGLKNLPSLERFVQLGLRATTTIAPYILSAAAVAQGGTGIAKGVVEKELADLQASSSELGGISALNSGIQEQVNQTMQQISTLMGQLYKSMGSLAPSISQVANIGASEARAMQG